MQMSYAEFEMMLPRTFWNKLKGWQQLLERQEREAWERTRFQTWYLARLQVKKGALRSPADVLPFPWEAQQNGHSPAAGEQIAKELEAMGAGDIAHLARLNNKQ